MVAAQLSVVLDRGQHAHTNRVADEREHNEHHQDAIHCEEGLWGLGQQVHDDKGGTERHSKEVNKSFLGVQSANFLHSAKVLHHGLASTCRLVVANDVHLSQLKLLAQSRILPVK